MPVNWPTSLPHAPASYSEQKQPVTVHTQPDSGPTKSRRRFTKAVTKGNMEFLLTNAQANILDIFRANTLRSGAEKMYFTHPWNYQVKEMRVPEAPTFSADGPLTVRASFGVVYL